MLQLASSFAVVMCSSIHVGGLAEDNILGVLWKPQHATWHPTQSTFLALML